MADLNFKFEEKNMSHIRKETITGFDSVHPVILKEGIKIACELLSLQGIKISNYILDWHGNKVTTSKDLDIIFGLDTHGSAKSKVFAGMGIAIDEQKKLTFVGDFYYQSQKNHASKLQEQLKKILGGACYFAARALMAKAEGRKIEIKINQNTKQLQLVVEM